MSGRGKDSLAGGPAAPRQAPIAGQRWEVVHAPPSLDKLRRIEMAVNPWWGRSGSRKLRNARARLFSDGTSIYLNLEGWQAYGIKHNYRRRFSEWYRLLPAEA